MIIVESYPLAVIMCFVTMICWGSWANTQKLVGREWPFRLFYWDYALGVFIFLSVWPLRWATLAAQEEAFWMIWPSLEPVNRLCTPGWGHL
jgi:glucose uptake protein